MVKIGASFSLHRARELQLDPKATLYDALHTLGIKRFRLMSYWNIHEPKQGEYDFTELDWQMDMVAEAGGQVTLCLGKRQPRWPECHMPKWAEALPDRQWRSALNVYIEKIVQRYKDHPALESWQLENEALLKSFGQCPDNDYSHARLRQEFAVIKRNDTKHPVIMTLSDSWGIPWRKPDADVYGLSLYRNTINSKGKYTSSKRGPWFYKLRRAAVSLYARKPTFIHELQAEPWVDKSIAEVPIDEQLQKMDGDKLYENIEFAASTGARVIDLWGLEWWTWLKEQGEDSLWLSAIDAVTYFTDPVKK